MKKVTKYLLILLIISKVQNIDENKEEEENKEVQELTLEVEVAEIEEKDHCDNIFSKIDNYHNINLKDICDEFKDCMDDSEDTTEEKECLNVLRDDSTNQCNVAYRGRGYFNRIKKKYCKIFIKEAVQILMNLDL